jgi:hypothetical protein
MQPKCDMKLAFKRATVVGRLPRYLLSEGLYVERRNGVSTTGKGVHNDPIRMQRLRVAEDVYIPYDYFAHPGAIFTATATPLLRKKGNEPLPDDYDGGVA